MGVIQPMISTFGICCVFMAIQFGLYKLFFKSTRNIKNRHKNMMKLIVIIEILLSMLISLLSGIMNFSKEQFGTRNMIVGISSFNQLKKEGVKSVKLLESKDKDVYLSELYLVDGESILSEVMRIVSESYVGSYYAEQKPSSVGELYEITIKSDQEESGYVVLCNFTINRKTDYAIVHMNWKSIIRK